MTSNRRWLHVAGLALAVAALFTTVNMQGQIVIANETPTGTTFVVNKTSATAMCGKAGCRAETPMFSSFPVTCPAAIGQTCTFHISIDAKLTVSFKCGFGCEGNWAPIGFYQFLIDGSAPTVGPTDEQGNYIFESNVYTNWINGPWPLARQGYSGSVLGSVTNSNSQSHVIQISIGCIDKNNEGGCSLTAHWSTTRVDVFEP